MFKKLLFKFAKGTIIGEFVGTAFRYGSWAIPVKKVYNGKGILAFYHPCPSYENHIIISPKRAIKNLQQMELECYSKYFVQIFEVTKDIWGRFFTLYREEKRKTSNVIEQKFLRIVKRSCILKSGE